MRKIAAEEVSAEVARLFQEASCRLGEDMLSALARAGQEEESPACRRVLQQLLENARIAASERIPLCQDTGMAVVFVELGQEALIVGGDLAEAIQQGVRRAYQEAYLRKSVVERPFSSRKNTGDNTPAVVHTTIVPGEALKITALAKGFGSENMSRLAMLPPAAGRREVVDFVVRTVDEAGANPCPPLVVGVGIGGTAEKSLLMAKGALLRRVGEPHPDREVAGLEEEILAGINGLGIGAMGYGGTVTALAVHCEVFPTHIASLPVAVNLQCHSLRHRQAVL